MITMFDEWQAENAHRGYPFSGVPVSENGTALPDGAVLDACICAGIGELPRLAEVADGRLVFADSVGERVIGYAVITPCATVDITDANAAVIGTVVFGDIDGIPEGAYSGPETLLAASAVFYAAPTGVTSLELPDGTLVSGAAVFKSGTGVNVLQDEGALRVDVVGVAQTGPVGAVLGFIIDAEEGSLIQPGVSDGALNLYWLGKSLDSACAAHKAAAEAAAGDACEDGYTGPVPGSPYPDGLGTALQGSELVTSSGAIAITADGAATPLSPIVVKVVDAPPTSYYAPTVMPGGGLDDGYSATYGGGGSIVIGLLGFGAGRGLS